MTEKWGRPQTERMFEKITGANVLLPFKPNSLPFYGIQFAAGQTSLT
jgi:hypothetical protein